MFASEELGCGFESMLSHVTTFLCSSEADIKIKRMIKKVLPLNNQTFPNKYENRKQESIKKSDIIQKRLFIIQITKYILLNQLLLLKTSDNELDLTIYM